MTKRAAVIVFVDLDSVPGAFHTKESAVNNIRGILENVIPHYNPEARDPEEFGLNFLVRDLDASANYEPQTEG